MITIKDQIYNNKTKINFAANHQKNNEGIDILAINPIIKKN